MKNRIKVNKYKSSRKFNRVANKTNKKNLRGTSLRGGARV